MGKKERFEVLLEEVRHDVKTIAEGLVSLRGEMERGFQSIRLDLGGEIAGLRSDLKLYMKQADKRLVFLEAKVK